MRNLFTECLHGRGASVVLVWSALIGFVGLSVTSESAAQDASDLIGSWEGTYDWDCGSGRTGSSAMEMTIDIVDPGGYIEGSVSYLDSTAFLSGWVCQDVIRGEFGFQACVGVPDPDGAFLILQTPGAPTFTNNTFSGELSPDRTALVGTTLNGDSASFGSLGCSAAFGPAGQFALVSSATAEPESISDCLEDGWEAYGFRNPGQCIRWLRIGR